MTFQSRPVVSGGHLGWGQTAGRWHGEKLTIEGVPFPRDRATLALLSVCSSLPSILGIFFAMTLLQVKETHNLLENFATWASKTEAALTLFATFLRSISINCDIFIPNLDIGLCRHYGQQPRASHNRPGAGKLKIHVEMMTKSQTRRLCWQIIQPTICDHLLYPGTLSLNVINVYVNLKRGRVAFMFANMPLSWLRVPYFLFVGHTPGHLSGVSFRTILAQKYLYKNMCILNRFETNCEKSMIPFHAIWCLCWYDFLFVGHTPGHLSGVSFRMDHEENDMAEYRAFCWHVAWYDEVYTVSSIL